MARGTRAPSQSAYQGALGRTQTQIVHVTGPNGDLVTATVYTTIDAVTDPELAERLHAGTLNSVPVPVVYHDPAAEVMVLVLFEAHRHHELDERIRLLERLRADHAAIPAYAKEFAVVFGADGLRGYLEHRAEQAVAQHGRERLIDAKAKELEAKGKEIEAKLVAQKQLLETRAKEVDARHKELDHAHKELERQRKELEQHHKELERMRSEQRSRAIAAVQFPAEETQIGPPPTREDAVNDVITQPVGKQGDEIPTDMVGKLQAKTPEPKKPEPKKPEVDEETTGLEHEALPPGSDPVTTTTTEFPIGVSGPDAWLDFAATGAASSFQAGKDGVRLALLAGDKIARGLGSAIDARVLLHRVNTYPVVVLVLGPPAALRVPHVQQLAILTFDVAAELDRAVLAALAKKFELQVDVVVGSKPLRRVKLTAPLEENIAYILRAADDHLRGIAADGETEASYQRARDLVLGAGYDLLGLEHAETREFHADKLAELKTAQAVRRAIAMARRFARPSREDYLVCARGFPLVRWRQLRRGVLDRAVAWGLWTGPELAQVAVSEGLARSRRDLVMKLDIAFDALRRNTAAFDLDADAADDNVKALVEEARGLGVDLHRKVANGAIKSEDVPMVSGSIERTPTQALPKQRTTDELLALLDDKVGRVEAAAELCDRGEARAAAPVINAVKKMSRAEAVRILGKSVKFGEPALDPLLDGLKSSKAFLRHGCALALGLLRKDEGTHAVIDLLLEEPTEIWREIARAIGQVGPTALMPLAARVGRANDKLTPQLAERVAWAMSHVGVRGGKSAIEQMANGSSVVAPIAKQALALLDTAARDEVRVRPGTELPKDVTVNRAFSRRFFEALEPDRPEAAQAALHELELDDGDVISLDEDEAELDESDLLQ